MNDGPTAPNPRRVAAGERNRTKRRGLTAEGREKLRQSALAARPWQYATGPRTPRRQGAGCPERQGPANRRGVHTCHRARTGGIEPADARYGGNAAPPSRGKGRLRLTAESAREPARPLSAWCEPGHDRGSGYRPREFQFSSSSRTVGDGRADKHPKGAWYLCAYERWRGSSL